MDITAIFDRVRRSIAGRSRKYSWQSYEALKPLVHRRYGAPAAGTVFIFGCQRSGTTHLERLFRADPRSIVHGEYSALSATPDRTVWMPDDAMRARLGRDAARYVVIRSLLASHRARDVLERWPGASAFWVFRDANSVVDSMVRKWDGEFHTISRRVETDTQGHWDLAGLWQDIRAEAEALAPDATREERIRDVYALFWLHRNALALDLDMASHSRVLLADYADVTCDPAAYIDRALALAGVESVRWRYPLETRRASRDGAARKPRVSPPIQERCDALYQTLRDAARSSRDWVRSA